MATVLVDRDAGVAHVGPGARWGDVLATSGDEHADLFWALRGGGGSLGVVTSMEIALHPVAPVYACTAYYAVERATETLARYRDWIADAPDALSTAVLELFSVGHAIAPAQRRAHAAALVAGYDEAAARPFDHSALWARFAAW